MHAPGKGGGTTTTWWLLCTAAEGDGEENGIKVNIRLGKIIKGMKLGFGCDFSIGYGFKGF